MQVPQPPQKRMIEFLKSRAGICRAVARCAVFFARVARHICACAKAASCAGQYQAPNVVVGVFNMVKREVQAVQHGLVHGVQIVGIVKGERCNLAVNLQFHKFEVHYRFSPSALICSVSTVRKSG